MPPFPPLSVHQWPYVLFPDGSAGNDPHFPFPLRRSSPSILPTPVFLFCFPPDIEYVDRAPTAPSYDGRDEGLCTRRMFFGHGGSLSGELPYRIWFFGVFFPLPQENGPLGRTVDDPLSRRSFFLPVRWTFSSRSGLREFLCEVLRPLSSDRSEGGFSQIGSRFSPP